jgi:hypothetical protein
MHVEGGMAGAGQSRKREDIRMSIAPDKLAKARAFWAAKAARRKSPFNCGRCGNILLFRAHPESDGAGRMCPKCCAWMANYRRRKREKPVTVDAGALAALETRIAKAEHNLAMMQLASRVAECAPIFEAAVANYVVEKAKTETKQP